jgi:UTP--glucose-1-phosphate uridylyltransferase
VKVKKAVITAAAERQRALPLQTLIDRDGEEKSVLGILVEQALSANVEEICVVVWPGDEERYAQAVGRHLGHVRFTAQPRPLGYGDAICCAGDFTSGEPFLHLVGDHLWTGSSAARCASSVVELAEAEGCSVSAVQVTRENLLPRYGAVAGRRVAGRQGVYRIETVIEKPTPTEAEQRLVTPGLRAGHYLCFFGMHVFTPALMEILCRRRREAPDAILALSPALAELAGQAQYLAVEERDQRFDLGSRYGLLIAQLALALNGRDRDEVLSQLVLLLSSREQAEAAGSAR